MQTPSTLLGAEREPELCRTMIGAFPLRTVLGLALLIWLPVHLALPLCRDQAIIALVTERILQGFWPYADTWEHKGPATYLLYLPALALFRDAQTAVNVGDVAIHGIAYLALRAIGRALGQPWLGGIGLVALVLLVRNDHWTYGQPETWFAALWLVVLALLVDPQRSRASSTFAFAGAVIGSAAMFKPVFVLLALLPLSIAVHEARVAPIRPRLLAFVGAGALATGALVVPFWIAGRLPALFDAYVAFNLTSHAGLSGDGLFTAIVRFVVMTLAPWWDMGAALLSAAALLGLRTMRREAPRATVILGSAWLVGLLAVIAQGKAFHYHYAFAHVAAAPFVAMGVLAFLRAVAAAAGWRRAALAMLGVAAFAAAALLHLERAALWWGSSLGILPATTWEDSFCTPGYCPRDIREAGAFIRRETPPDATIFNFGFDAALYLAADRAPASRYIFSYPLITQRPDRLAAVRAEAIASLTANPPAMIVVQGYDKLRLLDERSSAEHLPAFPELAALIAERYAVARVVGQFTIHRLRR